MSFVKLMCKAAVLEKRKKRLMREKKIALELSEETTTEKKRKHTFRLKWVAFDLIRKCKCLPENSRFFKLWYNLRHEGSCENYVLKSVVGFIGGFILTYIFFMFFVFQLNFTFSTATIMCSIFGSILTIGLAFSYNVRCIVFLMLPQLFSKRGRQALLAYAFILAITGPAKNTLNNMGILSESLACGQEQLKQAVKQILEVVKKPFYAIRDAIKTVVGVVKNIVKKIKEILLTIKRIILSILKVIKAVFKFLARIINVCNKELGTPFQRCTRVFEDAIIDCHAKLGPMFSWLCSITYIAKAVCYTVKLLDFICEIVDFIGNSIIGVVIKKVKQFVRHIKTMFYVRIRFSHSFHFETNASKTIEDVAAGIVTEVKERTEGLMKIFDFMSCATSLFFIFIVVRVLYYRYKFLSDERFDNRFINKEFRDIDLRRAQLGKETVLPLNKRERNLYISVKSIRLVKKEKVKLSQTAVVLGIASLKLGTHMIADYALFWVLTLIRHHASFQSSYDGSNIPKLEIKGKGLLADLLRSIVKAFQPAGINLEIDTVPCLPDPIPPDYDRYVQIASLLVICWVLTIFEPYGLRWRNSVMCFYYPLRAKQRAIWLYNHIIRTRSSFLKFVRRQLRRKFGGDKTIAKVTCREYFHSYLSNIPICKGFFKPLNQTACVVCGEIFREQDKVKPIRCQTPGCAGTYCEKCFEDLQNMCTICLDPIQYGDLSDVSEEKDSSEFGEKKEENEGSKRKKKKTRKKRKFWCKPFSKKKRDRDDDDDKYGSNAGGTTTDATTISSSVYTDTNDTTDTDTTAHSYQYHKNVTQQQPLDVIYINADVEKQKIPDYVSMETFKLDPHSSDKVSTAVATYGSVDQQKQSKESDMSKLSLLQRTKEFMKSFSFLLEDDDTRIPLLDLDNTDDGMVSSGSTETTFIDSTRRKPKKRKAKRKRFSPTTSETTFIETPKHVASDKKYSSSDINTSDASNTLDQLITNIPRYKTKKNGSDLKNIVPMNTSFNPPIEIPKLNLEFTDTCKRDCGTDPCTCRSTETVHYHTESETNRSARSITFSTPLTPQKSSFTSTSSEYSGARSTHRETVNYLYNVPDTASIYKRRNTKRTEKELGDWEALSNTTETESRSYRDRVRSYYSQLSSTTYDRGGKNSAPKSSKFAGFLKKIFKRGSLDSTSASTSLTKSFLSESEEARSPERRQPRSKLPAVKTDATTASPTNFNCDRGVKEIPDSVELLFMGGTSSSHRTKDRGNNTEDNDSVIVEITEPPEKTDIQQKFGWYDSTDSDLSELNYTVRRKKRSDEEDVCDGCSNSACGNKPDGSGDQPCLNLNTCVNNCPGGESKKYSLKDCSCDCPKSIALKDCCSIKCKNQCVGTEQKQEPGSTTTSTSTTVCYCKPCPAVIRGPVGATTTETGTSTSTYLSHESTQTYSESQMNIDRKHGPVDRYSREPPERDQNYDRNYMKPLESRYAFEHGNCARCPCKSPDDCKGNRPPEYSHPQYSHGSHGPHSPHGVHSSFGPHTSHNHSPHPHGSRHNHNQPSYHNQSYSQNYQDYQQYNNQPHNQMHSPQSKSNYNQSNQQQPRRCPPPPNFERKRTTYDLAKSVENLRNGEHGRINSQPQSSKTNSHSVPEVGRHKPIKQECNDYNYIDYANANGNKYPYEEPSSQDRDDGHDRNCSCDFCHHMKRNSFRNCTCCECRKSPYEEVSTFSEDSQPAPQNVKQCNVNLTYQKNDEYPVLVDEIETTISQKNKERVRNTMRQFELLSRQNKALVKPIYDDDEEDDRYNPRHYQRHGGQGYTRCNDRSNTQPRKENQQSRAPLSPSPRNKGFPSETTNSRWEMDQRTGEWYKVHDDSGYDFQNNYPPLPDPPMHHYRDQDGYHKGSPNSGYYNSSSPVRSGSPNHHHHYSAHAKSCNCRHCIQHRY